MSIDVRGGITLQSEVERLRTRTHELQERHDKEMATLRKQLKQEVRRTEAYRASWWHESLYQHLTVTMLRGRMTMAEWRSLCERFRPIGKRYTEEIDAEVARMDAEDATA